MARSAGSGRCRGWWSRLPARAGLAVLALAIGACALAPTPPAAVAECPIPPAFDPGVGELYLCDPEEGERHLIAYARRSYSEEGLGEDIWLHLRGVFGDRVWINVGTREANDTSLPATTLIRDLIEQARAIKGGDPEALRWFLAPIEAAQPATEADRVLKARLLAALRSSPGKPGGAPVRPVLYHVHLRPTREIEERAQMPINHLLSIPSHSDLLYVPTLLAMDPAAELRIAVPAGIWSYGWDLERAERFVAAHYDGPAGVAFPLRYAHAYTRFAITEYHRQGLNDPDGITPEAVARYLATLAPTGAALEFRFAEDWAAIKHAFRRPP